MFVYRVASKKEIDFILEEKDLSPIGDTSETFRNNTHKYIQNEIYMHFFKEWESFLYLSKIGSFLCIYDIDEKLLESYKGVGYYLDLFYFRDTREVEEYAVPSKLVRFDNLVSVEYISDVIDIEDVISKKDIEKSLVLKYKSV